MFESITKSLTTVFDRFRGRGRLTKENIQDGLREIRTALLEADVNYKVVKDLIQRVTEKAVGEEVLQSVTPGQQIVKIIYDELVHLMGPVGQPITFQEGNPTVIMLVGLHGCGKTTTTAKLAKLALSRGRKPLLVAADIQRPAAVEQLKVLGKQLGVPVYSESGGKPPLICEKAVESATKNGQNVVIMDTAGRLHIDEELMAELREVKERTKPHVILFVCDAMTGQDAVNSAREFNSKLEFDGAILTKLDGDTRGGAALSVKAVTGKPIKYVGVGEKLEMLEEFYPDRMASRILGMGDVITLVEKAQAAVEVGEAKAFAKKIKEESLTLEDFLGQLQKVKQMGPLKELISMIPGMSSGMEGLTVEENQLKKIEAMIYSMTQAERKNPDIIDGSRRQRIAKGSATTPQDINQLLKQFRLMKKMLKQMSTTSPFRMGLPKGLPVKIFKGKGR